MTVPEVLALPTGEYFKDMTGTVRRAEGLSWFRPESGRRPMRTGDLGLGFSTHFVVFDDADGEKTWEVVEHKEKVLVLPTRQGE